MASLPSQHPRLALHLTDRALTPLISSPSFSSQQQQQQQQQQQHQQHPKSTSSHPPKRPTFSTSPLGSPSDESSHSPPPSSSSSASTSTSSSTSITAQAEEALTSLTGTALSAYDAAKRLGKGAPLRTMVEYPDGGAVVLHSYMCPMSMTLGTPGRNASSASLHTSAAGVVHHYHQQQHSSSPPRGSQADAGSTNGDGLVEGGTNPGPGTSSGGGGGGGGAAMMTSSGTSTPIRPLSPTMIDPMDSEGEGDVDEESPNGPPMLTGTVVAPRAEDLREARRAAGRLERIARVFQTEWLVEGGGA